MGSEHGYLVNHHIRLNGKIWYLLKGVAIFKIVFALTVRSAEFIVK